MHPSIPILLAPAGSFDALIAACAAGADAVYLGGRRFGARQFAVNFTDDELEKAVHYAHLRGVSVYVTVNTLIAEREMKDALEYLVYVYSIGVDAVLVQDIGLLSLIRRFIPDLVVHASTQMGIHNIPGALYAATHGCRRIVLARELTGDEIKHIADCLSEYPIDLEVFVHGALCYGYSGRCMLSSLIGGRSGNRGMCAQPCRKRYSMMKVHYDDYGRATNFQDLKKSGYIISTKDLCLYSVLDQIVRLPVAALKIEGRMRTAAYVAFVTSVYRKALDAIRSGTFHPHHHDIIDLSVAFSRQFTHGYISGLDYSHVMGRTYPGNQGYYLGRVISCQGGIVKIQLKTPYIPCIRDGIVFRNDEWEEGFHITSEPVVRERVAEFPIPFDVKVGDQVYLTSRETLVKKIADIIDHPDQPFVGSLRVSCSFHVDPEGKIIGTGEVHDRHANVFSFSFTGKELLERARTRSLTKESICAQLAKTGGTLFSFADIQVSGEEGWFAPIRVLNALRRDILQAATLAIVQSQIPTPDTISQIRTRIAEAYSSPPEITCSHEKNGKVQLIVLVSTPAHAQAALSHGADRVYIAWEKSIHWSFELSDSQAIGIMVPGVMRENELDIFCSNLKFFAQSGVHFFLVDSVGMGEYIRTRIPTALVSSFYGLPIANFAALQACDQFEFCTLSPELSEEETADICRLRRTGGMPDPAICCQGLIEAVVTEDHLCEYAHVPHGAGLVIRDEKAYSFPVYCESSGRSHIMNSLEHSLFDEFPLLYEMGIRWFIIDARFRSERYIDEMTAVWKRRIMGGLSDNELHALREKLILMSYRGITRSGFRRGLSAPIR